MKFAVALGKSPGHGPDKARRAYNFLPKHATEYDLSAIEKKIMHKLEDRCEVRMNDGPAVRLSLCRLPMCVLRIDPVAVVDSDAG